MVQVGRGRDESVKRKAADKRKIKERAGGGERLLSATRSRCPAIRRADPEFAGVTSSRGRSKRT